MALIDNEVWVPFDEICIDRDEQEESPFQVRFREDGDDIVVVSVPHPLNRGDTITISVRGKIKGSFTMG